MYEIFILYKDLAYQQHQDLFRHWEIVVADPELQKKFFPHIEDNPYPDVLPYSAMKRKPSNAPLLRPWDEWGIKELWWKGVLSIYGKCRNGRFRLPEFLYHHVGIRPELVLVTGDGYEDWPLWDHRSGDDYRHWFYGGDSEGFGLDHEYGYDHDEED